MRTSLALFLAFFLSGAAPAGEGEPGKPVNGQLTRGEDIADLGGLAIALDALMLAQAKSPRADIAGVRAGVQLQGRRCHAP